MNRFGLEEKYLIFLKSTLKKNLPDNAKFYIFGSRAKGTYKDYSDIDIAIDSRKKISENTIQKISFEFEDSTLPYEVDVVDLNSVSDTFKSLITGDLIEL